MCMLLVSFVSCVKEPGEHKNSPQGIQLSTSCSPGSFSIVSGVMSFDSFDDYNQTTDYLSCASDSAVNVWAQNLSIPVSQVWLDNFSDSIGLLENDSVAWVNYWNAAVSQGIIGVREEDGEYYSTNRYPLFRYFIGAAGYFKIGNGVYTEKDFHIISIPDGSLSKLATALTTMQTDTAQGIFVEPYFTEEDEFSGNRASSRTNCCPENLTVQEHATNNGVQSHRLRAFREKVISTFRGTINGIPFAQTSLGIQVGFEHHRRGFLGFWASQRRDAIYSLSAEIDVLCGAQTFTTTLSDRNIRINNRSSFTNNILLCVVANAPAEFCIRSSSFSMPVETVNFSPALNVTLPCNL
jgi:hypothetical protein